MAWGDDKTVINENNLWILESENGKIHCRGAGIVQFLNSLFLHYLFNSSVFSEFWLVKSILQSWMSASITSSQGYSKDWEGRKEIWILRIPRDSNLIGLDESDEKIKLYSDYKFFMMIIITPFFILKSPLGGRGRCCCIVYFISLSVVDPEKSNHLPCLYAVRGWQRPRQWHNGLLCSVLCAVF